MTNNEVMVIVLEYLKSQASNKEYIGKLNNIIAGISGKKHIEETDAPSYKSILFFGYNIFPFTVKEYREIANEIKRNHGQSNKKTI